MASRPNRLYWDTSVFIEFFNADPVSPWFISARSLLAAAKKGRFQICTSVLAITEVAYVRPLEYLGKRFVGGHEEELDKMWLDYPTILTVRCDDHIARTARDMLRWAMLKQIRLVQNPDLVHIATAMFLKAGQIHTTDKNWFLYSEYAGIPIGYPEAPAPEPKLFPEAASD